MSYYEIKCKLPTDFKKKWIDALRSGDYDQGKEALKTASGGYCCLGVACDVNGTKWEYSEHDNVKEWITFNGGSDFPKVGDLPNDVHRVLTSKIRPGSSQTIQSYIASMNDEEGRNFDFIANWIEENL